MIVKPLVWRECPSLAGKKLIADDPFGNEFARIDLVDNITATALLEQKRRAENAYLEVMLSAIYADAATGKTKIIGYGNVYRDSDGDLQLGSADIDKLSDVSPWAASFMEHVGLAEICLLPDSAGLSGCAYMVKEHKAAADPLDPLSDDRWPVDILRRLIDRPATMFETVGGGKRPTVEISFDTAKDSGEFVQALADARIYLKARDLKGDRA
jgi:hypothetical protein